MIYLMESSALSDMMRVLDNATMSGFPANIGPFQRTNDRAQEQKPYTVQDRTAQIELTGVLSQKRSFLMQLFGFAPTLTYPEFVDAIDQADADPEVDQIAVFMDTPGGEAAGVDDAAVALAVAGKPTTVYAGTQLMSAGYYIASQADKIIAKQSSLIGSIGTAVAMSNPPDVVEIASSDAPKKRPDLNTDTGRQMVREQLDEMQALFLQRVAEGRATTIENVRQNYGQGGFFNANNALKAGMIDGIESRNGQIQAENQDTGGAQAENAAPIPANRSSNQPNRSNHSDNKSKREKKQMDFATLKAEHPETFAQCVELGVKQERERVSLLQSYIDADPENEKVREIVQSAITSGATLEGINAKLQVALRDGGKTRQQADSPPAVPTANADTGAGAGDEEDTKAQAAAVVQRFKAQGAI